MKNCHGTKGAPCYFSPLDTLVTPIDEVTLRLQAPYPFCGPEGSFGSKSPGLHLSPVMTHRPLVPAHLEGPSCGMRGYRDPVPS